MFSKFFNAPFVALIVLYRFTISPMLGVVCRFHPTCSEYALEAFTKYAFPKAFWLTLKRIAKCHPYHPGGHDPLE